MATKLFLCPGVVDCFVERALVDSSDLQEQTKDILEKIDDALTQTVVTTLPASFIKSNEDPKTDDYLETGKIDLGWKKTGMGWSDWKKGSVRKIKHKISRNFSTVILGEDDLFNGYSLMEKVSGMAMRSRFLFSLDDSLQYIKSDKVAAEVMADLKLNPGALPETYNTDFNMVTDESFSRIFFNGIGAPLIAKQEEVSTSEFGPFVVDMPLQHLPTRKLYKAYGCRVHFDENQKVTAIYDYVEEELIKPGEEGWEAAKMHAKVTCFTLCTVREHLIWTHLIVSNDATRESVLTLPPSHPIRRLLTIFTFRATEVNLEAFEALVPRTCLLHRAASVTYSGMVEMFDMSYRESIAYQPFPDRKINPAVQKLVDEGKFPYVSEGIEYYEIVRDFVRDWLSKAGDEANDSYASNFYDAMKTASQGQKYVLPSMDSPDAMANVLSSIIFAVTGYHELIGHVVDYVSLPSRAGFRLAKKGKGDQTRIDTQSFFNAAIIGASTSKRMPMLMREYPNYIAAGGAPDWEKEVWASFQTALEAQEVKVKEAESERTGDAEFKYFDPRRFECSVSV